VRRIGPQSEEPGFAQRVQLGVRELGRAVDLGGSGRRRADRLSPANTPGGEWSGEARRSATQLPPRRSG
jgi:hypothetical protein